jgi:methyltransferase (TIGR00027 family)
VRAASRTAILVCQGRAAADGRLAPGVFSDPVALDLLTYAERDPVEQVRAERPPAGWSARTTYESVRACAEILVPRTVVIDEAATASPHPQVVVLGAGLDSRAWRLPALADRDIWEVDHLASQQDKRERVGDREPIARSLRFVPVDFAVDDLGEALATAGHRAEVPTTWLWEGVVPYLTQEQVAGTLAAIRDTSAPGSTLVVNYQSPSLRATIGRRVVGALSRLGGGTAATANEPWRTLVGPREMEALLHAAGFAVRSDEDLLAIAGRLGLEPAGRTSLAAGRVAVAVSRA